MRESKISEGGGAFKAPPPDRIGLSAKFDDFQVVIEQLNTNNAVSVICLQETWLSSESSTSLYDLPNYQLISRGKYCSNHGGLITYVHNDYNWEHLNVKDQTTGWENLFLKITHRTQNTKKIYYRKCVQGSK